MIQPSLNEALNYLRGGEVPRQCTGEEHAYILACLPKHPNAEEKIGSGVRAIHLREALYGQRCYFIERVDGTEIDFSIYKCFRPSKSKPDALFRQASREASEVPIVPGFHMHHEPPNTFEQIVRDFLHDECIDLATVKYDRSGLGVSFKDVALRQKFKAYHDVRAVLTAVTIEEHHAKHREE